MVRERTDMQNPTRYHRGLVSENDFSCACGHERTFHDPHGCAAFLGGFAATAHIKRYCGCKRSSATVLSIVPDTLAHPPVVAEVRVRERRGTAIGVCEFPPVLELGPCAEDVLLAIKTRLRALISPPNDRTQQALRVVHERERESSVRVEALW